MWFSLNSYIPVLSEDFALHDRTRGNESKSETNLYSLDDNAIDNRHKILQIMQKWKQNFFLNRERHYKLFIGEVKSMFNAVFEETLSILKMHFISKNGQNSKICYGTYFLHIT